MRLLPCSPGPGPHSLGNCPVVCGHLSLSLSLSLVRLCQHPQAWEGLTEPARACESSLWWRTEWVATLWVAKWASCSCGLARGPSDLGSLDAEPEPHMPEAEKECIAGSEARYEDPSPCPLPLLCPRPFRREKLQIIYLIKDLYSEHMKNSYNSLRRQSNKKWTKYLNTISQPMKICKIATSTRKDDPHHQSWGNEDRNLSEIPLHTNWKG